MPHTLVKLLPNLLDQRIKPLLDIPRALSTLTPIAPNVPICVQSACCALAPYVGADLALVVAVVPLADCVGDFYGGVCADVEGGAGGAGFGLWVGARGLVPRVAVAAA